MVFMDIRILEGGWLIEREGRDKDDGSVWDISRLGNVREMEIELSGISAVRN